MWAWGLGTNGRLGNGSTENQPLPVQVTGITDVVYITAGTDNMFAIRKDGSLWAWGLNTNGQLGISSTTATVTDNQTSPQRVRGGESGSTYLEDIVHVSAAKTHTIALKANGSVYAWGTNGQGQLGIGYETSYAYPMQVIKGQSVSNTPLDPLKHS